MKDIEDALDRIIEKRKRSISVESVMLCPYCRNNDKYRDLLPTVMAEQDGKRYVTVKVQRKKCTKCGFVLHLAEGSEWENGRVQDNNR